MAAFREEGEVSSAPNHPLNGGSCMSLDPSAPALARNSPSAATGGGSETVHEEQLLRVVTEVIGALREILTVPERFHRSGPVGRGGTGVSKGGFATIRG